MGNRPPTKGREEAASGSTEDRISELPLHILHHKILSLLPQEDAVRTCLLSKSWRHIGPTRPKIEFRKTSFRGRAEEFISAVENTLHRYVDQNLFIQEFILDTWETDSLLHKWIPIVIMKLGVKTFNLKSYNFSLPSLVFQAEFLEELYLKDCKVDQINDCVVKLHVLKRLELCQVGIEEETFEKIMSSCPLIQHLVLECCKGLSNVKVNKARNLKHFYCVSINTGNGGIEIDDAPSLKTIRIRNCYNWYHLHNNYIFPRLKSLYLCRVHMPTESLNNLSSDNCPCLEELQLYDCTGFSEFKLSNCSIKRLIIKEPKRPIKVVTIDAANMLYFEFGSDYDLPSISFAPTSRECKSLIHVRECAVPSSLYEILKALSQSQISLYIFDVPDLTNQGTYDGDSRGPLVVEHFIFCPIFPSSLVPALLKIMFRICRPSYIGLPFSTDPPIKINARRIIKSTWKILVKKRSRQCKFWKQDLEESSIQVFDKNTGEWRSLQIDSPSFCFCAAGMHGRFSIPLC